jgi:RHS repeat-associated protein
MESEKSGISSNVISLPEGGGAMSGLGETFSADLFSGTGNYSVPIAVPKGRLGMQPQLSLGYSTGNGNGICGLGWNLSLPGVSRKTSLGIPQYRDEEDTFVLSGAEDLLPVEESIIDESGLQVKHLRYQPRTEGLFARITHITAQDGRNYWEVKTKDGKTSLYGNPDPQDSNGCRISDPQNEEHIFHWCIYKTFDLLGNEVVYHYQTDQFVDGKIPFSQLYLDRIEYADFKDGEVIKHLCSVKLNYEERIDAFSRFNSGFEIRTRYRLKNIETYTHPFNNDLPTGYTPSELPFASADAAANRAWCGIAYGSNIYVAVAQGGGSGNRLMRSTDGITWTLPSNPPPSVNLLAVTYANGVFIAVSTNGSNRIYRSTDLGESWSGISSSPNTQIRGIAYGNGVFVAVSSSGTNRAKRSTDGGLTWQNINIPGNNVTWNSVTYGEGVFVAVGLSNGDADANLVARSTDFGQTWTLIAATGAQQWGAVTYGNNVFVAVARNGSNRVMRSIDGGQTWSLPDSTVSNVQWRAVAYGAGQFVAVAHGGTNRVAISNNLGLTWQMKTSTVQNQWRAITYGNNEFIAVSANNSDRVMRMPVAKNDILVKRYKLTYLDQTPSDTLDNGMSLLSSVEMEGDGPDGLKPMTPVQFGYTQFDGSSRDLIALNQNHLPSLSLADPSMSLVDLDGNGLPDFVQIQPGVPIRYWKNRGRGKFDLPKQMKDAPLGLDLTDGTTQFMDADGDGRADLVMNSNRIKGYYPLQYDGTWDQRRYTPYKTSPTINFASADVQFMDLTGDGRTDVIINGDRSFECYFQNSPLVGEPGESGEVANEPGWTDQRRVRKGDIEDFPNVNFSDPRIRTADLSGDGLQDIVMISNGSVAYWPNLGYGRFGSKRQMLSAPRPGFDFDPNRVILADINGDGLTDFIYINSNSVDYWINQSGNRWGEQKTIKGTPRFTSRDSIVVADIMGTGTPGLLWTYNAGESRDRMYFVDLTRGQKPYLLNEVDNNLGALTRVHYKPSTEFYLNDLYGESPTEFPYVDPVGPWKTTLPFPTLTVSKVEAIDKISNNKLVTRYFYHHGYWDGVEREFRGFGRVDQFDTETFEAYNADDLVIDENFDGVTVENYSPPIYTKNWFNVGPVQLPNGDWGELDMSEEYWSDDPNVLSRPAEFNAMLRSLTRRGRRDALRTLRGSSLRTELYAKDGSPLREKPYTVQENQTTAKYIDGPEDNPILKDLKIKLNSGCIFFPFQYSNRQSVWERGEEPKTSFNFTGELDEYGQVKQSLSISVPRGKDPLTGTALPNAPVYDSNDPYRAILNETDFAYKNTTELYFVDRTSQNKSFEITGISSNNVFEIRQSVFGNTATTNLLSHQLNFYDGAAYLGLPLGQLGDYGLPVRSESLVVNTAELDTIYGTGANDHPPAFSGNAAPNWSNYPSDFVNDLRDPRLGYAYHDGTGDYEEGYYATGEKLKYDVQDVALPNVGFVAAMRTVYQDETSIDYDNYCLLPLEVIDPLGMTAKSVNDYRVLSAWQMTDANDNVTKVEYDSLGLVEKVALCAKDDGNNGDTLAVPGTRYEYDFFAFVNRSDPISVKKIVRENHINAPYIGTLPPDQQNATIESSEYSDGYGRIVQMRAQAEDVIFGDQTFGDSGLPPTQGQNGSAIGIERGPTDPLNVVVSGRKRYNNKGEIVEQYEPYFSSGFDYVPDDAPAGVAVKMHYDALGRMVRAVNPDDSEQRVVFGIPAALNTPNSYAPTPWERYTYTPNDLAPLTNPGSSVPQSSWYTPKSEVIDTLGNVKETTEHKAHNNGGTYEDVVMKYEFDIKSQLIKSIDPFDRDISVNYYTTAGQMLRSDHIDRGTSISCVDAMNLPVYARDARLAESLSAFDTLQRPIKIWAKDSGPDSYTLRQIMEYGDSAGLVDPQLLNLKGKLYTHNDEAGKLTYEDYDFKGNNLNFFRQVIEDDAITSYQKYVVDWNNFPVGGLSTIENRTTQDFDALNRIREARYPEDVNGDRRLMTPTYNKAGTLESVQVGSNQYVGRIAYNARGQKILETLGNQMMMRYVYDNSTFRLVRSRVERYNLSGLTYAPNWKVMQDLAYTYDLEGTVQTINDRAPNNNSAQGPGNLVKQFTHDPLRRLLSATGRESSNVYQQPSWDLNIRPEDRTNTNTYTRNYTYDKIGNILTLGHIANGQANQNFNRSYTYSAANNYLNSFDVNSTSYANSYDAAGNLIQEGVSRFYEWGANTKMAVFKNQVGGGTPTVFTNYFYNSQGERIKKVTRKGSKLEVTIYVDGGIFETSYVKQTGTTIDPDRHYNTVHVKDGEGNIVIQRVGPNVDDTTPNIQYIVSDHLGNGTVRLRTDRNRINREEYYPFGETSFGSFTFKRYRYNGKEKDSESGLYEYGQRYYAPWLCRFVSVDPIAESFPHLSSYNYASNRPVTARDLEGLQANDENNGQTTQSTSGTNTDLDWNMTEIMLRDKNSPTIKIPTDLTKYDQASQQQMDDMDSLLGFLSAFADFIDKLAADTKGDADTWDYGVIFESNEKKSGNYQDAIKLSKDGKSIVVSYEVVEMLERVGTASRMYDVAKFRPGSRMEKQQTNYNEWRKKYNGRGITNKMLKGVQKSEAQFIARTNSRITNSRNQNTADGLRVLKNFVLLQLTKAMFQESYEPKEQTPIDSAFEEVVVYSQNRYLGDSIRFQMLDTLPRLNRANDISFNIIYQNGDTVPTVRRIPLVYGSFMSNESDSLIIK